ncbi:TetR/AcrR family transcriptional regulator [Labedaea rhizosphaerae]|uniref:TetR/AcrR family transcriptional regulator n=1 Tax=Labedaea rhizosphaerae TaxID=598644 RepID=UPI001FB7E123|nr:TetR/AcrR family transcriptional regulator [Labedaea rhizosphaerae]
MTSQVKTHRTQAERSERTRELLLDATIDCLVDLGYSGASVHEICRRAGVSRGAQQHHFATKAELMTSALRHLFGKLNEEIAEVDLPAGKNATDKITTGIDVLWDKYSGTLSTAAMELWVAARTDAELREALLPVDRELGHATLERYRATGDMADTLVLLTVNLTRGLALDAMLGGDPARREKLLAEWKRIAVQVFGSRSAN